MPARLPSFWLKTALAAAAVVLADVLIYRVAGLGLNLAILSLAWVVLLALANPAIRHHRLALVALVVAALFAALQVERPTFVGWLLFAVALAVAALAPRAHRGDDGWRWAQRLVAGGLKALIGPVVDLGRVLKARARSGPVKLGTFLLAAVVPVVGGAVFLGLFTAANPVISTTLASLNLGEPDLGRGLFWIVAALPVWAVLRPRGLRRTLKTPGLDGELDLPGVTTGSVTVSLAVFNLVFALQNGLDIAYLWSGAGLPKGVTFADYAHQGAYPLIATALLAGLFVLLFLRPGTATAASRPIRRLVILWIAQNVFLVASTALRTLDYVEAYSLTRMRIAALLWMALVAVGLVLILWRLLRAKSSSWLLNSNLVAVGSVLMFCSVVDLGTIAAVWNTRDAAGAMGQSPDIDFGYLSRLGGAAVVPLAELELRPGLAPGFRCAVTVYRRESEADLVARQAGWRTWRWRDVRRLARVEELTHERPMTIEEINRLPACPVEAPPRIPPLTPTANPRT